MKGIGRCIRKYRERAGITQEQLAEKVNISTNHLGAIEREVKTPTMDTFVKILNVIGAEPNEALKEENCDDITMLVVLDQGEAKSITFVDDQNVVANETEIAQIA